jgi:hypothetical protein
MVRTGVARGRVAVPGTNHLNLHFLGADHGRIEIVDLKPKEDAVSVRQIRVADGTVFVFHIPAVQLQSQSPVRNKALVLGTTVRTLTAKETLIPAATRFDITHANQWLWAHWNSVVNFINR